MIELSLHEVKVNKCIKAKSERVKEDVNSIQYFQYETKTHETTRNDPLEKSTVFSFNTTGIRHRAECLASPRSDEKQIF